MLGLCLPAQLERNLTVACSVGKSGEPRAPPGRSHPRSIAPAPLGGLGARPRCPGHGEKGDGGGGMRRAGTPRSQPRAPSGCDDPRGSLGCVLASHGGGEAERGTPGAVLPAELLTHPGCSPGHPNPKAPSLQLGTGLSKRQGASCSPTDAVRGLGAAPRPQVSSPPVPRWGWRAPGAGSCGSELCSAALAGASSLSSSSVGRKQQAKAMSCLGENPAGRELCHHPGKG